MCMTKFLKYVLPPMKRDHIWGMELLAQCKSAINAEKNDTSITMISQTIQKLYVFKQYYPKTSMFGKIQSKLT